MKKYSIIYRDEDGIHNTGFYCGKSFRMALEEFYLTMRQQETYQILAMIYICEMP